MPRFIAKLCTAVFSALGISAVQANEAPNLAAPLEVKAGDVIVQPDKNGWSAIKILVVDVWPDGSSSAHCLTYKALVQKPTIESLKHAPVLIWHAPIAAESFRTGWQKIGNQVPTKSELVGFEEYLKLTDFPRYLTFTGQDSKTVVGKANEHYRRAYALGDQNKRAEAIAEYSQAIDLFPLFYEAIDNRAFTYMELGQYRDALKDFEASLRVNPDGIAAFFSKGECLMRLGDLQAAAAIFKEGQKRFPEKRAMFTDFLNRVQATK
jgi:tetratricopeptide (TPR) repeat protein